MRWCGALVFLCLCARAMAGDVAIEFDIPSQPLNEALKSYARLTRQPTLFSSELVAGVVSAPVTGRHTAEAALRILLEGTGLAPERVDGAPDGTFVLKPVGMRRVDLGDLTGYPGLVQAQVMQSLCRDARTAPGNYRSLLRFQVDTSGQIQHARLIGSTGDTRRDSAILAGLQHVRMDTPPPAALAQPMTMLILPNEPGRPAASACTVSPSTP